MSCPDSTRSDLCSIPAAGQPEFAGAARSLPSADGYPLAGDDLLALLARAAARTLSGTGVLRAFGYPDRPGGGCLVMSRHDLRTEAGR